MASKHSPASKQPRRARGRQMLVLVLVGALILGVGGGVAFMRLNPAGTRGVLAWLGRPTAGSTRGTLVAATPVPGSPQALFQRFNAAITSYQAQPMDAHSKLRLIIPKIHVNAPILERGLVDGWMVVAPGEAVTHFIYSAYPGAIGNSVMYSHAGTMFRHLDSLGVHDTIVVQTPSGTSAYQVRELRIVAPNALAVLDNTTTATLTLLTCYPFGVDSSRLVIIADLVA
ncbi:MAG: sortase [Ktedonobacterales bacterium]|nr:sortase [Ktedonobacterales bacterium]